MTDWQPARLIEVHDRLGTDYISDSDIKAAQRKVVFIRPIHPNAADLKWIRKEVDCPKGDSFFEIRDDFGWGVAYVCEHEFLTD
jgi:hypothetical protein